jgi:glycosyltransferase involved in cell wall biosynthesis
MRRLLAEVNDRSEQSQMRELRTAFVQPIVDPVREAWFRQLVKVPGIALRVFALREQLSHRPGWKSRQDAGFDVEYVRTLLLTRYRRFVGSAERTMGVRLVPLDLLWRLWRFRPDVIVVTNATELMQALLVRWVSGAKIVLSAEDTKLSASRIGPVRGWFKRVLLKRADMYCAHSSAARELLLTYGVPVAKIISTPWAVDNEQFSRWAAETNAAEQRRKLDVDGVVFVTVGSLIPRKGIDQLLAAFRMVPADLRAQGSVLIVGDGPERQRLTELAQAQGLTNVRFVGHLPPREVAACLAAGDIFVLPTLEDVWGLVISEAMAAGLPILCSKYAGGAQDLVRDGVNGRVFDPLNHVQLSASLRDVLEHPEQLREMGRRSREIIAGFTIDGSISSLAEALRASVER